MWCLDGEGFIFFIFPVQHLWRPDRPPSSIVHPRPPSAGWLAGRLGSTFRGCVVDNFWGKLWTRFSQYCPTRHSTGEHPRETQDFSKKTVFSLSFLLVLGLKALKTLRFFGVSKANYAKTVVFSIYSDHGMTCARLRHWTGKIKSDMPFERGR